MRFSRADTRRLAMDMPAVGDPFRMHRASLRFVDAREEATFAGARAQALLRPIRIVMLCAAAFLVLLVLMGRVAFPYLLPGFDYPQFIGIFLGGCALLYAATYTRAFLRWQQECLLAIAVMMSLGIILVVKKLPEEILVTRGYVMLLLHLFSVYGVLGLRFPSASAAGWTTAFLYVAAIALGDVLDAQAIARHAAILFLANVWGMVVAYQIDAATRRQHAALSRLALESARSERLLLNILPSSIAERLKSDEQPIADHCAEVTVLFADIVGFTPLSSRKTPADLVNLLNLIFLRFDELCERHGLEKIKTIGDAYMAVAGLPTPCGDHARIAARCALAMVDAIEVISRECEEALAVRIGLHSGPVVAGVIGKRKFSYDLWGDTVNVASRMESHGVAGRVQCSAATAELLRGFPISSRGPIEIEGKGSMSAYLLSREGIPECACS